MFIVRHSNIICPSVKLSTLWLCPRVDILTSGHIILECRTDHHASFLYIVTCVHSIPVDHVCTDSSWHLLLLILNRKRELSQMKCRHCRLRSSLGNATSWDPDGTRLRSVWQPGHDWPIRRQFEPITAQRRRELYAHAVANGCVVWQWRLIGLYICVRAITIVSAFFM